MIRSLLTLRPAHGDGEAVVRLYRAEQILQESLDLTRAVSSEVSVATDGSGEVIVTALWPDEDAYREWLDHPSRGRTSADLLALLSDPEIGTARLYRIDQVVTRP